jgi:hypothetical protein
LDERWDRDVEEIGEALSKMLLFESSNERVRAADEHHDGFDAALAQQLAAFGLTELEGSPALFARIAFELGKSLASVGYVETMPVLALL